MKLSSVYKKGRYIKRKLTHPSCAAVIVAAGQASRMGGVDKITAQLAGMPVLCRTLEAFDHNEMVDEVVVVAKAEKLEPISSLCAAYPKVRLVVPGGATRLESVRAGVSAVSEKIKFVAVHDGARPLVSDDVISNTIAKAIKFGAAAPAVHVKDTIKVSQSGAVDATPDRRKLFAVQTPQVFDCDLLKAALQNAVDKHLDVTDDCSCVEALGMNVQLTDGSEENIKITTPLDLDLAELILKKRTTV